MHLGIKMNIPYEAFDKYLTPTDYSIWVHYKHTNELYWEGNSMILAIINLIVTRYQNPTKYIKLECR